MRSRPRTDATHAAIVSALRACGASVVSLAGLGDGTPDLLVGYRGHDRLLEVKAAHGRLRATQLEWHARWAGRRVVVVRCVDEALEAVGVLR